MRGRRRTQEAVLDFRHLVRPGQHGLVMRDHERRDAVFFGLSGQQFHHFPAAAVVQHGSRLVHQQQRRFVHERPGDPHPLAFAARHLVGPV